MTEFNVHTEETAPEGSKGLIRAAKGAFGFLPNLLAVQSESPAMIEAYMTLADIFGKTDLSETERQIILMTNNRLNGCTYCMAAHTSLSQMAKVPDDIIDALRNGSPISDTKLEALRVFATQINNKRGWVEQDDLDAFFAAGYNKANVLDVILGTGLKVLSNFTNHIAQTPVDRAFQSNAWTAANKAA